MILFESGASAEIVFHDSENLWFVVLCGKSKSTYIATGVDDAW